MFDVFTSIDSVYNASDILCGGMVNQGIQTEKFERLLAERGLCNPLALQSCTAALHLSMILAGVRQDDEVILPSQGFISCPISVSMVGGIPVWCDVKWDGNANEYDILQKITPKTKAILVINWAGNPLRLMTLYDVLKEKGIKLIVDNAHSFGSFYQQGNHKVVCGDCQDCDFATFSLQCLKTLHSVDGGILCCRNKENAERAERLRWFGIGKKNLKRDANGERIFNLKEIGYKYNYNDVFAAIAIGNLPHVDKIIARRREIALRYNTLLRQYSPTVQLPTIDEGHTCWLYTILSTKRKQIIERLRTNGIPAGVVDNRLDINSVWGGLNETLVGQKYFSDNHFCLPCHRKISFADQDRIVNLIGEAIA